MGESTEELNADIENTRQDLSRNLDALEDRVSPNRIIERRKEAARGRITGLKDKVMGSARNSTSSVGDQASSAASSVQSSAHGAMSTVEEKTEGNPLAAGLIAFGAGALVASMLPASKHEERAAQQVVEKAKDSGVVDEAKSMGQEMGSNLKDSATEAAEEVKSTAKDSAQNVKEEGQSSAQRVQP